MLNWCSLPGLKFRFDMLNRCSLPGLKSRFNMLSVTRTLDENYRTQIQGVHLWRYESFSVILFGGGGGARVI